MSEDFSLAKTLLSHLSVNDEEDFVNNILAPNAIGCLIGSTISRCIGRGLCNPGICEL